uniref:Nuclear envelope pore membrane protein POM 121C n=1 Tax=Panthera tigris altaica TaxID=74533 RepID=A0A8C9M7N9_PANTA
MVCSPVTVRIAPPDSKLARSPIPEQIINSTLSSPSNNAPDPCAKETVLSALKERKKRTVEEEDQIFFDSQENKRRRHDSSGSGHSAFEPLVANGVPAAFVPKPGSLKRGLNSQSSDDHLNKRSRTSSMSSLTSTYTGGIPSSSRNAITSSYSSSRGFSQLWKRSGPSLSPFSSPASSRSQTPERPAKKIREDELSHRSSSSTPLATDKEAQGEKATDTTTWKAQNSWSSPPTPGSSGQRKRKIQLLPSRRGARLTLPPPPQLGYSITAEDLDLEKRASLRWFNKALEDGTDTASNSGTEKPPTTQPSLTFTLPTTGTAASPAALPAPSPNPLLESLKKKQSSAGPPPSSESAGVATTGAHTPPKTPSLPAPLGSSQSGPLPAPAAPNPPAVFLGLPPPPPPPPATDPTKSPPAPQAETSAPSPTPKQSLLLGMLSTPPADPPTSAAPAVSSASPMFKPIFLAPPKSENEGPLPSSPPKVTTVTPSGSALPAPASSPKLTFEPIFGSIGPPTSVPSLVPFFSQTAVPATATSTPLFTGQAGATSAVAPTSTASTSTDSASKPTFSFGVSSVTSTTTSAAQPFLFGAPPASGASFTPAVGSIFQFGNSASGAFSFGTGQSGTAGGTTPFGGGLSQSTYGINAATPGTSSASGAFSFGTGQSGTAGGTTPFGGGLSQSTLGAPSQSTPFAFSVASAPESKPVFGGTSTPTFGQNTPAPGVGASGSGLSFGASSTPTQGFVGVGPFGKQPRLQARRQHTRKK